MIPDRVSGPGYFFGNLWPLLYEAPNEKKGGTDAMPGEYFQDSESVGIVGAIVESQRQMRGSGTPADESPPVELGLRGHGVVSGEHSRRGSQTGRCQ
jgi:hypothetical protein